jgi:hypothetical protein
MPKIMPLVPELLNVIADSTPSDAMDALVNATARLAVTAGIKRHMLLEGLGKTYDYYAEQELSMERH